jgi:hypothetical protein
MGYYIPAPYLVTIISNKFRNATVEVTPVNYTDLAAGNYNATLMSLLAR